VNIHVPIPEALLAGSELVAGRYRLEQVLGMGGMGYVVAATDVAPEGRSQRVAVKFMLPDAMKSASLHRRFVREVEAIGRLRSEHVCRLLDAGRLPDGAPFMVMEHLVGSDLERLVADRGALPLWEAADYTLQILDAIAEAHGQGIIHRDLKPANVFLAQLDDGAAVIKVLDFGVAKAADGLHSTATDSLMGSPSFMAPEQIVSSKRVDERADIYSIGSILYYLLTGRPPFEAEQLPALCLKVLSEDPIPPTAYRQDLPPEVDDIVLTCMAHDADGRYPNAAELAYAIMGFASDRCRPLAGSAFRALGHTPGSWRPPARSARSRSAVTVVAVKKQRRSDDRVTQVVRRRPTTGLTASSRRVWQLGSFAAASLVLGVAVAVIVASGRGGPKEVDSAEPVLTAPAAVEPSAPAPEQASLAASPPASAAVVAAKPAEEITSAKPVERVTRSKPRRRRARSARSRPVAPSSAPKPAQAPGATRPPPCSADDPLCAFGTDR
jgi:serine/threonine-protein kinase